MECPKCQQEIPSNIDECPECGVIISKVKKRFIQPPQEPKKEDEPIIKRYNPKLRKCPDCEHDVSYRAKTCPQCGADLPQKNGCSSVLAIMFLLFIVLWGYNQYNKVSNKPPELSQAEKELQRAEGERKRAIEYELCKTDLKCWAEKHDTSAIIAAEPLIEKMAKYQFEWTDGILEPKLLRFRWHNIKNLSVTYIGDKIKMQNGFGAWQNMIYEIDYDTINKKVIDIRLRDGRL